jgi:hypothetical protein
LAGGKYPREFWHTNEVMKARCLYKLGRKDEAKTLAKIISSHPWPTDYYPSHVIQKLSEKVKEML